MLLPADPDLIMLHAAAVALARSMPGAPIAAGSVPAAQPLVEVEKQAVVDALRRAKSTKMQAAAALGLSRGAFYRRLERFGFGSHT